MLMKQRSCVYPRVEREYETGSLELKLWIIEDPGPRLIDPTTYPALIHSMIFYMIYEVILFRNPHQCGQHASNPLSPMNFTVDYLFTMCITLKS